MQSSIKTEIFERVSDYKSWRSGLRSKDERPLVGFVPTMGALHSGHLRLIEEARSRCQNVVVSIFVNPLQFGPNEDFNRYPRTFPADTHLCQQAGVDAIFHPGVEDLYERPLDQMTKVVPPAQLVNRLCGAFRPGHFEGVATVVLKLFEIVEPSNAYFGEKDYQQLTVIRRMVQDLNLSLNVVGVPTVREKDGLAMSSRNVYLGDAERELAPRLHEVISTVQKRIAEENWQPERAIKQGRAQLECVPNLQLQYLEACDPQTLEPLQQPQKQLVVLVAAKLGDVRLIDNVIAR